ncbi:crosslink repair DNA glycosylase YcaQ family protein [Candidatus Nephthysia bennettiae]|uniref:DNA glycosylase AlkZ-like family protein n=1 Tax=Candidatus Nephthysia bennettiae TaxID=3127016 RepID=UPI0030C754B5
MGRRCPGGRNRQRRLGQRLAKLAADARLGGKGRRALLRTQPRRPGHVRPGRSVDWRLAADRAGVGPGEVFRRYLRAYGPATADHFGQWFDLAPRAARRVAADMREELAEVSVEGQPLLLPAEDADADAGPAGGSVRLLPHFDCYLRGFHPRTQLVGGHGDRAAGGTGRFPVLLVDGRVAGVWERRQRGRRLEVRVDVFGRLGRQQSRQLQMEAARIGAFDEIEAELTTGPVEVNAHL